jgi:Uma2 family endonuclease
MVRLKACIRAIFDHLSSMSVAYRIEPLLTEAEYLAGEELSEVKHEFHRGEVVAMAGSTDVHNVISLGIASRFNTALRGKKCRTFIADMKVRVDWLPGPTYYYPDVMVACDDPPPHPTYREQPLVIVEVLSKSTDRIDRKEKLYAYTVLKSVQHYLVVSQYAWEISHYFRTATGWELKEYRAADEVIELPEIQVSLTVADVYEDSGVPVPIQIAADPLRPTLP